MKDGTSLKLPWWSWAAPVVAALLLAGTGRGLLASGGVVFLLLAPLVLVASVFGAVFHAETISRRLGETLGAILLALAVTVIEVSMIVSLMLTNAETSATVARDTVFAGVMVVTNGVVGFALIAGGARHREQQFKMQGTASALGVLATLAAITMVLPDYTTSEPGPAFSPLQLVFVSVVSLLLYGSYLFIQATSQRSYFSSIAPEELAPEVRGPMPLGAILRAAVLLVATLLSVALLANSLAPEVERVVRGVGLPLEFVAVIVAAVVLLPEGTSSVRAARDDRLQTSLNYALGSAIASTGLTIPAISLVSTVLDTPIQLGLAPEHMVLLTLTLFISALNLSTGRTTVLQGMIHLVIFGVFLLVSAVP